MFIPRPPSSSYKEFYTILTLVDITRTDAVRVYNIGMNESEDDYTLKRNQQRNRESILQAISLRTQPIFLTDPVSYPGHNLADYDFGSMYEMETLWAFDFGVEHEAVLDKNGVPGGELINDLHNVPIISGLYDTAEMIPAMFDTKDPVRKNTIILK